MKLLLLLLLLVPIAEAIYIKDFDHADYLFDTGYDEEMDGVTQATLQDDPIRDGSTEPQNHGLDESYFGEETVPLRAMRISSTFKLKIDSPDNSKTTNANVDDVNEETRRPFAGNEVGPLRASRRSEDDANGIKEESVFIPVSDQEEQEALEDYIVDGSGEEVDAEFGFDSEADDEDEDGMEFQGWGGSLLKGFGKIVKGTGKLLTKGGKAIIRGGRKVVRGVGRVVKKGVKKVAPHLKDIGREFGHQAKEFLKTDGMDILFDGVRGVMGRESGDQSQADYEDTEEDKASNPYYDRPTRGHRDSVRETEIEESGAGYGTREEGSRRRSGGGHRGSRREVEQDAGEDDASPTDEDDADDGDDIEDLPIRGKPGRGNTKSERGSGRRDEEGEASGVRAKVYRPNTRKGGRRGGSSDGGEKQPERTEKRTDRGPNGKPMYNFKKGQSAEDAAEEAFKQFAERMGEDIAEDQRDKITECIEDAFFDENHEADNKCSRYFKQ